MKRHRHHPITVILCALVCVMFAYEVWIGLDMHRQSATRILFAPSDELLLSAGAAYTGMDLGDQWPRLVKSVFLHGGLVHLAANLIALWQLGAILEELFGGVAMLLSFSIGGVAAGLASLQFAGAQSGMVYVGASGAIFAIAGTLLVGLRQVTRAERTEWSRRLSSRLVGCLAFNFGLGLLVSAIATWADLGFVIANSAHLAGLVSGLLVGLAIPLHLRKRELTERLTEILERPRHHGPYEG